MVYRFAPMTTLQNYDYKHETIKNKLLTVAKEKLNGEVMKASTVIAKTLEISPQTVYNYLTGRIKDGYLAEAILREINHYKAK